MDKLKSAIPHFLVIAIVLGAQLLGLLTPILSFVTDWRFEMTSRPVSGELVMVGIDPKSLDALGVWPWPRSVHARLLEKLQAAGAAEIVMDIDFSTPTSPREDGAFEAALAAAKGAVILPVFRQTWAVGEAGNLKATRPLDRFARNSWLASVGVLAQKGGLTRVFPYGDTIDGEFVPSIPAFFSKDAVREGEEFFIDFAIRPQTLRQVSYVDVLQGRVGARELAGKKIIVGANAVELRDNFAVPIHGVVSGPMLQAISTESVLQNRALSQTSNAVSLAGLLLIVLLVSLVFTRLGWRRRQIALMVLLLGIEGAGLATQWLAPVIVDTSMWLVAILAYIGITMMQEIDCRKLMETIARTQSKNTKAILDRVICDNFAGILIADQDGRIQTASRVAARYLDLASNLPLVGMNLDQVLPSRLAVQARAALDGMKHPGNEKCLSNTCEIELICHDGSCRILDFVVTPSWLAGDTASGAEARQNSKIVAITFRDVTEIRKAARDMQEAAKAAISANQAKTDFLATMSHELRTPLNAIIGFSDLMKQQVYGPLGHQEYGGFAEQINASGAQLLGALNAIMSMAQVDQGQLELTEDEFDMFEIIAALVNRVQNEPDGVGRDFVIKVPDNLPLLFADQRLVVQMLSGILGNAAKFTSDGGTIRIEAAIAPSGEMSISVADDGIGIAPEHIDKVTDSFYQANSAHNRSHEGCGLGLTLSAAFARAHQGRLEIESEVDEGTRVTVVFPARRVNARHRETTQVLSVADDYECAEPLAVAV